MILNIEVIVASLAKLRNLRLNAMTLCGDKKFALADKYM